MAKAFRAAPAQVGGKDRFVVTGLDGNVADDAQGYGHKDRTAAYRCYAYKQKRRTA